MLQNKNTNRIQYDTLNSEEKKLLKKSCTNNILNKAEVSLFDETCACDFTDIFRCNLFRYNNKITESLLDLMDFLSDKNIKYKNMAVLNLTTAIYNNIIIPYDNYDIQILEDSFKEYIKLYFDRFIDDEIIILLLKTYKDDVQYQQIDLLNNKRDITRDDILERIPFIIDEEYRRFFKKLRKINRRCIEKYIVKYGTLEIDASVILEDLLNVDFEEFW